MVACLLICVCLVGWLLVFAFRFRLSVLCFRFDLLLCLVILLTAIIVVVYLYMLFGVVAWICFITLVVWCLLVDWLTYFFMVVGSLTCL